MKVRVLMPLLLTTFLFSGVAVGNESASNRSGKTGYAALEVIGFTLMPVSGVRGGYFISPDLVTELSYASGSAGIGDFKVSKTLIELKAKYFFGNSFYVDGGLANESFKINYPVFVSSSAGDKDLSASVSNLGAVFHIGNQWQWSGFTMGVDWAGYFASLSSKSSFSTDSSVDAADKKKEENDIDTVYGSGSIHAVRYYLGWTF